MGRFRVDRLCAPPTILRVAGGGVLAVRCYRASSRRARLIGLLGTPDLAADEALWLEPCASVHAFGLRARIGCALLDSEGRVLRVVDPLAGGRIAVARGAAAVVECAAGVLSPIAPGTLLRRD